MTRPSIFVGHTEGRDLFENYCDVAICDEFVGNIVLKPVEKPAEGLFHTIAVKFDEEEPDLKSRVHRALESVWGRYDYSRYGDAPLWGVYDSCIICHGRISELAIRNAVKATWSIVRMGFNEAFFGKFSQTKNQDQF